MFKIKPALKNQVEVDFVPTILLKNLKEVGLLQSHNTTLLSRIKGV